MQQLAAAATEAEEQQAQQGTPQGTPRVGRNLANSAKGLLGIGGNILDVGGEIFDNLLPF